MDVVFFEPWYGGSHRGFLDAWTRRSRHGIVVHGLAARHWKWRQEASAWELARRVQGQPPPDVIACSDFVDLPRLIGFLPPSWRSLPTLAYFHENQLTYQPAGEPKDFTHGFSNILTALRADEVVFNSSFHLESFREASGALLRRLPRPNPRSALEKCLERATAIPPLPELKSVPLGPGAPAGAPLRVVFPHRLESDKNPRAFFRAVELASQEAQLEIVVLGGDLDQASTSTQQAAASVASLTLHAGYASNRDDYLRHLGSADLVVSTARHEFFGIAFAEAIAAGCQPLAPDRLNYPALVAAAGAPPECLYADEEPVDGPLVRALVHRARPENRAALRQAESRGALRTAILRLDADHQTAALDVAIDRAHRRQTPETPQGSDLEGRSPQGPPAPDIDP